jgi:hypothetical protein
MRTAESPRGEKLIPGPSRSDQLHPYPLSLREKGKIRT